MTGFENALALRRLGKGDAFQNHAQPFVDALQAGRPRIIPHRLLARTPRNIAVSSHALPSHASAPTGSARSHRVGERPIGLFSRIIWCQ